VNGINKTIVRYLRMCEPRTTAAEGGMKDCTASEG